VNLQITDISPSRKKIIILCGEDEAQQIERDVLKDVASHARIPGFRPGKAPIALVKQRYAQSIQDEYIRQLVQKCYDRVLDEKSIQLYKVISANPEQAQIGQAAEVELVVDIAPEVVLSEYKNLSIDSPSEEVTPEEVEVFIQERREELVKFEVSSQPAQKGDYVKLSYVGRLGEQDVATLSKEPSAALYGDQKNTWEQAGSEDEFCIQAITKKLVGITPGEHFEVEETFPTDFKIGFLAGQTVRYSVDIHEVRMRVLPALDEADFLKHHGVDNVEALRTALTKRLSDLKKSKAFEAKANQILQKLSEQTQIELPVSAIEDRLHQLLERFIQSPAAKNMSQEDFERDREKILAEFNQVAQRQLKEEFILDQVVQLEKITLTQEDLQRGVWQQAMMSRQDVAQYVRQLEKDRSALRDLQKRVLRNKAVEWLVHHSAAA